MSVNITIEGLIALFFRKGAGGQIVACEMGVVRDAPGHAFSLNVRKSGTPVSVNPVSNDLRLDVQNVSQTGISFNQPNANIDRLTGAGDPQSFRWVLDFEGDELYRRGIGADRAKLRPVLRIDHGELRTREVSTNHLVYRRQPTDQWTLIGKVATRVGALINLDQGNSVAQLMNGGVAVPGTRTVQGEQLDIVIRMGHTAADPPPHPDDANHYHLAVGQGLGAGDRVTFSATPFIPLPVPVSPEASCLVGRMGTTVLP